MKSFLFILLLALPLAATAQTTWAEQTAYQSPGKKLVVCGEPYVVTEYDARKRAYRVNYQKCKTTVWKRSEGLALVHYWNGFQWLYVNAKGTYWSYTWQTSTVRVPKA